MSPILILFESGKLAEVRVTLYKAPGERSRLLDAYVTTECEGSVTRSARRAAEAVLNWLPAEHRPKEPMIAGFDISGLSTEQAITGESGGLAFAIALAAKLTGKALDPLAATGILADSDSNSEVMPVKAVCAKVKGAIAALPSQSTILLPQTNQKDCDDEVRALAEQKAVSLEPVVSLDQALSLLFGNSLTESLRPPAKNGILIAGVATAVILLAILAGIMSMHIESAAFLEGKSKKGAVNDVQGQNDITPVNDTNAPAAYRTAPSGKSPKEEPPSSADPKAVPSGKGFD